ncbi:hypothetical protein C0991_007175 [Blastosporella zonata]|nr:hypothetical protein C0991_007175 [Blastosporella zonata]
MTDTQEMPLFEEDNKDFETSPVRKPYATSESLGKRKAHGILGRVNMDSGPSSARPTKVLKTGSGQPSTKQAKVPIDISGAHATDKDLVDEGMEGDIACQQCTTTKVADHCWYPQARVVRKREKRAAAPATWAARASDDDEEGPVVGPSNTTPALPTLGAEDNEEEILGEGILRVPKLDGGGMMFERVTRRVGESRELEAGMADYAAACEQEYAVLRFELLQLQTVLGKTRRLQGTLVEARREAEEALWEILAFD